MWAVGYSGVTTRGDVVTAPALVTAGPYAYVRNPLYVGNFLTAAGFALAFTGKNTAPMKVALAGGSLAAMLGVYATIVPHEEAYLRETFGEAFDNYASRVPAVLPLVEPSEPQEGSYDPDVIGKAESRTFATFGAMLAVLALKALKA
jgi:protein-S-isoprenylcysteine O-methyltransferase Ste14